MERTHQFSLISALILSLVCLLPSHTVVAAGYSYYVDYFKVQTNAGVQQDNFDDGNISPWSVEAGTAQESGGSAILSDPGSTGTMGSANVEITSVETSGSSPLNISVGSGDATATSHWITNVHPTLGQSYMMGSGFEFDSGNPVTSGDIYAYTGLANADQTTANALSSLVGTPVPTGLFAFFEVGRRVAGSVDSRTFQIASITDTNLFDAGSLFLKLHYDDLAQEIAASIVFGNDENGSAWEPFNTVAIPSHPGDLEFGEWALEVDSFTPVPIPAALPLFGSALGLFGFIGRKRRAISQTRPD
ncbi:MAG: VPLPA-CTERM sorting domain-containing protein [Gammaproteobacteria bacterium]